jgi:hypothetical protein
MTRATNAKVAGVANLVYLAAGIGSMAARDQPHAQVVLDAVTALCALVLGVTYYAFTRDEDREIAMIGLGCRVIEAVPNTEGTIFFAVGMLCFTWLFLRGRIIPVLLAQFGVVVSALLVVTLFVQRAGLFGGAVNWSGWVTWATFLPMLAFELMLSFWLLTRGVAAPARTRPQA